MRLLPVFVLLPLLASLSCDFLPQSEVGDSLLPTVEKPVVEVQPAKLVKNPSLQQLGAWYCPVVFSDPIVRALCEATLGPVPADEKLVFRFELPFHISNPNSFPLPAVELLTSLSLFPGETSYHLAALCVTLCEETDTQCLQHGTGSCESDEPEITSAEDLVQAAWNYLQVYIASEAAGEVPPELKVRLIPANGKGTVLITLDLLPEPLLEALEATFDQILEKIVDNETATVEIPYAVEGAIWFVVENFGRFGVNYGPIEGKWVL
ncbi:MAG: hypothetical protein FJ109_22035 [Deltaproteobacteria bacterium]|nr:hypothetical protein [Deltaproteobacteria bacterium]